MALLKLTGMSSEKMTMALRTRLVILWIASWAIPISIQSGLSLFRESSGVLESPATLFWLVLVAASLCVVVAAALIHRALATNTAELGFIGLFYMSVSALPLVHGITTPGVLYGENSATMASVLWAIPVGLVVASPMFTSRHSRLMHFWRIWVFLSLVLIAALSAVLLTTTEFIPAAEPRSASSSVIVLASMIGTILLSHRHYKLAMISQSIAPLTVSVGYGFVAASAAVWFGSATYSIGFWSAHAFDIMGVFTGLLAAIVVYRKSESARSVLAPIVALEPITALEVGLEPIVHEFVEDLRAKDLNTRDHVVRTAELAILVADQLGMDPHTMRRVGLAGLLHDVGKLRIPDDILTKPDRLTRDEYEIIKGHAATGAQMVLGTSTLADTAPAVRSHHERIDGTGYPDGLAGDQICAEARVVAACDAYDAMTHTRHYRDGMDQTKAVAILREHAGSQWDKRVVNALIKVVAKRPVAQPRLLLPNEAPIGCDCLPATV